MALLLPKTCKICGHPQAQELNGKLLSGQISLRSAAKKYDLDRKSITRHMNFCLANALRDRQKQQKLDLVKELQTLEQKTTQVVNQTHKDKQYDTFLKAVARRESQIKLKAELTGQLQEKKPNEEALQKKRELVRKAVEDMIQQFKLKGVELTWDQAIEKLSERLPEVKEYVH